MMTLYLLAAAVLFLSTLCRSAIGFGDAVVAMPLLALFLAMKTAAPLVAFAATTIAVVILARDWRGVDLAATGRLILSSLAGIPIGLFLLKDAPEDLMKAVLGAVILLYGAFGLWKPGLKIARDRFGLVWIFGFVAGVLGGAYNTNGPPVVIYASLRRFDSKNFRATLQGYFLPTGLCILIGHGVVGLWTREVFLLYAAALPAILCALFLGNRINRTLAPGRFDGCVYLGLIGMGAVLLSHLF